MDLLKLLQTYNFIVVVMVVEVLDLAGSLLLIRFDQAPPTQSRYSTAVFRYSVYKLDGSDACENNGCSFYCEIDGLAMRPCPSNIIELKKLTVNHEHKFYLNVTTWNGERNSSYYSWFIDTVPPTATLFSTQNYTNSRKITMDVTFSEACTGLGGFKCENSSNCNVVVSGEAHINTSSLRIVVPNISYSLDVILSQKIAYGLVLITMADNFCTDRAGNHFIRTNGSSIIIHFDRRPVLVDLWTSIPSYELVFDGVPRTVFATNKREDLEIFLDFTVPIKNSTEEIVNALRVNSGNIVSINGNHGNHRFVIKLKNITTTDIVKVELQYGLIVGITGTPVSPIAPVTFLYDTIKPGVKLSTSPPSLTRESDINVIVEFTKPVFGFEASLVEVDGGKLSRFREHSRALYSLSIVAMTPSAISIVVPSGKVYDISGNRNLESNLLGVKYYSTPAVSIALHSFITAGTLATSLATFVITLGTANLAAIGGSTDTAASNPSLNLQGMVGHLQVFVFSNWILVNRPIEYFDTTKGLMWLIPRRKLPWKKDRTSIRPNLIYLAKRENNQISLNFTNSSVYPKLGGLHGEKNISMKNSAYGLPLNSAEYFIYFLRGEPLSARNVIKKIENYDGWEDLEMNLYWVGVGGGCLVILHFLILLLLKWRTGKPAHVILSVPRFELFLLILILPSISQSSAFVMRGGTTSGIITGALLLAIPAAFILSIFIFFTIAIFTRSFAQYKEIRHVSMEESWFKKLVFYFTGRSIRGKWFYRNGIASSFLPRFGNLFESRKGPPSYIIIDQTEQNITPTWSKSDRTGSIRIRAPSSDESNEEIRIIESGRFLGCAQSSYIILDLLRRVGLGIICGVYASPKPSQSYFALGITLLQVTYLVSLKPYIGRGVHIVECISLLSEVCLFGISLSWEGSKPSKSKVLGFMMLGLLILTFIAQIINEWHALIKSVLMLAQPQKKCFKLGLKNAGKGLILPFLPRKYWSRVTHEYFQPNTVLATETELERRVKEPSFIDPISDMSATVVPVVSPRLAGRDVIRPTGPRMGEKTVGAHREWEGRKVKGVKLETMSEMKKLRELAKASFSGD